MPRPAWPTCRASTDGPVSSVLNVTDGAGNTASANGAAITRDTTADGGGDLTLSIGDTSINHIEKGAVAFTTSGIDGDVASATVTFSDGTHSRDGQRLNRRGRPVDPD